MEVVFKERFVRDSDDAVIQNSLINGRWVGGWVGGLVGGKVLGWRRSAPLAVAILITIYIFVYESCIRMRIHSNNINFDSLVSSLKLLLVCIVVCTTHIIPMHSSPFVPEGGLFQQPSVHTSCCQERATMSWVHEL